MCKRAFSFGSRRLVEPFQNPKLSKTSNFQSRLVTTDEVDRRSVSLRRLFAVFEPKLKTKFSEPSDDKGRRSRLDEISIAAALPRFYDATLTGAARRRRRLSDPTPGARHNGHLMRPAAPQSSPNQAARCMHYIPFHLTVNRIGSLRAVEATPMHSVRVPRDPSAGAWRRSERIVT